MRHRRSSLGVVDDMWFNWITDFGLPGPDRGEGGKYLFVPPDYKGELPGSGYFVQKMRTTRATLLGRSFLEKNDPKPVVALIKKTLKVYPYLPGGYGTSIGSALEGKATLARTPDHKLDWDFLRPKEPVKFTEGTGKVMNTVPPSDFSYFEMLNDVVQKEPVGALDPEIMGSLAAIGIVKGKPFNPDARMKKILTDAAAIGNAAARTLNFRWRPSDGGYYYPNSTWFNPLFLGGYNMETPPPEVSADGVITLNPPTGARTLNVRTTMFFGYTFITPAMIMRLTDIGSQYLIQTVDSNGRVFRRQQDLQGHAAEEHSGGEVLVLHRLRQPDALDARHAAALPARRQPELSDARRRSERRWLDDRVFRPEQARRASATATGFKPIRRRAGSRSCASTARSNRSSRRRGVRARSNWFAEPVAAASRSQFRVPREVTTMTITRRQALATAAAVGAFPLPAAHV